MDSVEPLDPLGGADHRWDLHWCWDAVYLHALLQLFN
jgi:hypothetical protein